MIPGVFPDSYATARAAFRLAASSAACESREFPHPNAQDEQGATLTVDVARIGPASPRQLLVILSGMHGVELTAGSALQANWLTSRGATAIPADMALLFVHAVNALGCWQQRRMTDGNVDICRNFVDFTTERPENPFYSALEDSINGLPDDASADAFLERYIQREGPAAMIAGVMGGQYSDPQGFSYGGSGRTWSAEILSTILQSEAAGPEVVAVMDVHTGVGAKGVMTPICLQTGEAAIRARTWLGPGTMLPQVNRKDEESLHPASGHPTAEYERIFAGRSITSLIVEFGTLPPTETLPVLLREHRLTRRGASTAELKAVRDLLWQQHAPSDSEWQQSVLQQGLLAIDNVIYQMHKGN
jgi:hypothetical protein